MADDLRSLLGGGPPVDTGSDDDLGYIGMPKGYVYSIPGTASRPTPGSAAALVYANNEGGTSTIVPPRYQTGAELEPRGYSPENIAVLQQNLAAAGLIGPQTKFRLGVWDAPSVSAYRQLLTYANQGGLSREDALAELLTSPLVDPSGSGSSGRQTRTDVVSVEHPDTIRAAAHAAFKAATGRGRAVNDKTIEKFVAAFQAQQIGAQRKVNRAQDAVAELEDGPVSQEVQVTTPDLGSSAEAFAQNQAPAEVGAHNITKQFDGFLRLLGGIV